MTPDMFAAEIERRLPELVHDSALNRMTYLTGLAREFQDHIVEETIKTMLCNVKRPESQNTKKFFLPWK